MRANYIIEHEDEKDRRKRHVEFIATHKETGEKISVEAKSKHRPGILGRSGNRETDQDINLRFGHLINEAIAKKPRYPLVIFIDTNLPPSVAEEVYPRKLESEFEPHRVFKVLFDRLRKEYGNQDPFNLIVFTNHPHHYGREDEVDPHKHTFSVMPQTPLKSVNFKSLAVINSAANLYGNIPSKFSEKET